VIALPGRPQTVTRDVKLSDVVVPMSMTSTGIGATLFAVGVAQLSPDIATAPDKRQQVLVSLRDALIRNINGTITRAAPGTVLPADSMADISKAVVSESIEASGRDAQGREVRLVARFFVVDDRLYQLVALGGENEIPPEALDAFFSSFRIVR
jgi:hypothetical protein